MNDAQHLSNWGRWGADDQRGSLNLLTPELVKQAAGLVRTGKVYSLSMPLEANGPQWPLRHKTWKVTSHRSVGTPNPGAADDIVTLHSHSGTHIDALCHYFYDNHIYNGYKASDHITSQGITRNAIDNVPALVGRGVLLDVAAWKGVDNLQLGEAISADDLDGCAAAQGTVIQPGDMVLVRTGWMRIFSENRALYDSGEPGIDASALPWLQAHDIVAIGADNQAVEVLHSIPPDRLPVHEGAIRDLGIYLLENLNLDALAADQVYEFLLVVAPLQLTGGAGSPINPIAIA
ncbi:MAG TPA: cyclase family protein [Spirillospora sp.]|nr:cyclase family protein [Spirillospora sp.]